MARKAKATPQEEAPLPKSGRLGDDEVYRFIGPVDISAVLAAWSEIAPHWFAANVKSGSDPSKYRCDVVLENKFPPALKALMVEVDKILGGHRARAILRRLGPGQSIPAHTDTWMGAEADWRRFQLPLTTDPRIIMGWPDDKQELHLEAGNLYEVRFDRTHEVINEADVDRVHLQIDQAEATV